MADIIEVPLVPERIVRGEQPVKIRKPRITWKDADMILIKHKGEREAAAKELGTTVNALRLMINNNPYLHSRWSKKAILERYKEDALVMERVTGVCPDMSVVLQRQIDEHAQSMVAINGRLQRQITAIERRIQEGEEARFSSDPAQQERRFMLNDKGDPVEETLLRDNLARLYEEYRKECEMSISSTMAKAKISDLFAKKGRNGVTRNSSRGTRFMPKGMAPSSTVINAPNSQLVVNGGADGN